MTARPDGAKSDTTVSYVAEIGRVNAFERAASSVAATYFRLNDDLLLNDGLALR